MIYRIFADKAGMWRWELVNAQSEIIAISSRGYLNKADCLNAIRIVRNSRGAKVIDPGQAQLPLN